MMLTKEDLQAISELINGAVSASENRIMAYIESDVKKEIRQIADGHKQLAEKMDRMEQKIDKIQDSVDEIKGELTTQEMVITRRFRVE
ncbi:MAG: hypothetical protein ACLTEZ_15555 [Ruthenibacterium lactatiformans]|jgi:methyl-accepting chemotaxis protein|uniref:hypothetical protein n=2 Tax=Ruthenibacterium lactatiformans TaxID=1550024 RepID=UPI0006D81E01|nr:hypothetical protein [Ruthenibacterium lactatiformans]RJV92829.1 hypothetical protein DWW15_19045 [Subdoligranulum sp. AF14-43]RJW34958.1 hypothetical protein DXC43_01935 [Subdoligranulum sp. TF05-17AC]RJW79172.1 hypothetical protein DXA32_17460 [Subdoligranulum sp. OF01-18]DAI47626.1 MAG TPA: cGMP-gated cation channel protein [Caudoviricetes sp.]MBN2997392.1 hypothetical protein [Ruthenibacterium lactatiformans]